MIFLYHIVMDTIYIVLFEGINGTYLAFTNNYMEECHKFNSKLLECLRLTLIDIESLLLIDSLEECIIITSNSAQLIDIIDANDLIKNIIVKNIPNYKLLTRIVRKKKEKYEITMTDEIVDLNFYNLIISTYV